MPLVPWLQRADEPLTFKASLVRRVSRSAGDALWLASSSAGDVIGLAFDWMHLEERGLFVADPSAVSCNALLLDEAGTTLSPAEHVARFYELLVATKWQQLVAERLRMSG